MSKLSYRNGTVDDITQLRALEQKLIEAERPYNAGIRDSDTTYYDLNHLIAADESLLVVAEYGPKIVASGYAQIRQSKSCFRHTHHCYLGFIFVEDSHRGKNVASNLIERLKDWGVNQGISHFQLDVYSQNESAIRAYEKFGFSSLTVKMELIV